MGFRSLVVPYLNMIFYISHISLQQKQQPPCLLQLPLMTLNRAHDVYSAHGSQFFNNIFCNIPKFSFFPVIDSQISGQGFVSIFDNTSYTFVIFFLFTSWSFTLISCDFTINESELCRRYFIKHDVLSQLSNYFFCALQKNILVAS